MSFSISEPARGVCRACGSETELVEYDCHLCTRLRAKEKNVRVGGAVLTVLGLIVIAMMSVIINAVNRMSSASRPTASTQRDPDVIMGILNIVVAYGVVALIAGLWHLATGRVNKVLLYAMLGAGAVLGIGAQLINTGK